MDPDQKITQDIRKRYKLRGSIDQPPWNPSVLLWFPWFKPFLQRLKNKTSLTSASDTSVEASLLRLGMREKKPWGFEDFSITQTMGGNGKGTCYVNKTLGTCFLDVIGKNLDFDANSNEWCEIDNMSFTDRSAFIALKFLEVDMGRREHLSSFALKV